MQTTIRKSRSNATNTGNGQRLTKPHITPQSYHKIRIASSTIYRILSCGGFIVTYLAVAASESPGHDFGRCMAAAFAGLAAAGLFGWLGERSRE